MRWQSCIALLFVPLAPTVAADDVDDLLRRIPPYMNTVAVFQVDTIMKTPRALQEKWAEKHETEVMAGASSIPTNAKLAVVAGHLNAERIGDMHTISMIPLGYNVDMANLANREKGTLQLLGGYPAILSPRRGYLMNLNNEVMAAATNFDRQDLGRWVAFATSNKEPKLAKYLQDAVAAHKKDHVVIAIDMHEMFDPTAIRIEVIASNVAQGSAFVVDNFSKFIFGMRGLTISMNFADKTTAEFRLDFDGKTDQWEKQLTAFLPKFIDQLGADLDELKQAKLKFDDKSVIIGTELSDASLRRILSLITTANVSMSQNMLKADPKGAAELAATLRYYRAVNQVIDDLGNFNKKKQTNFNNSALWFDSFANKIDRFSITGVDDEMVAFASSISGKLRSLAGSYRGLKIQLDAYDNYQSVVAVGVPGVGYGSRYSSPALESNVGTLRTKQADLVAQTAPDREKVWSQVQQDRSLVRRNMAAKFKIDFDQFK